MTAHSVMNFLIFALLPILGALGRTLTEIPSELGLTIVTIPDGKLIGTDSVTVGKATHYHSFRGIPYAKPPINDLRFASPVKNDKWTGYWDATDDADKCVQGSGDDVRGSEDCLYINVYTPSLTKKNLPVMVWIYGGGFTGGNSKYRSFGPDFFLEEETVFVSFNYRVGIFGFLSTDDATISGNFGLKDQVLALKWVQENIENFGGDPSRVTIFGESAGGASVSYLLQIPKAQGLFSAAIMQSGTSEMLWALSTRARNTAFRVGTGLGINTLLPRTLLTRLRNVEAYRLQAQAMSTFNTVLIGNPLRGLPWSPTIEVEHEDAVFTQKSDDYFKSGGYPSKVPVLIGYNSNEAGIAGGLTDSLRSYLLLLDIVSNTLAPFSMTSTSRLNNLAANEIRLHFFGVNAIRNQPDEVVKFINTDQFNRPTTRVAKNIAPFAPTYFYVFGYEGDVVGSNSYSGVGHGEDLVYLFNFPIPYSARDLDVRAKLIRLWTNFAKTHNPTPQREALLNNVIWPAVNPRSNDLDFVWINATISLDKNHDDEAYTFYERMFEQFGDQSYSTF